MSLFPRAELETYGFGLFVDNKVFEGVANATFIDVELAFRSIQLYCLPDEIVNVIGGRISVTNNDPGTVVVMLALDSSGLLELSK
ncbi:MAG TPA: hypothetical protein VHW23_17505 [Kofleriaceae bacterium]|nr:hypothetical protein [Kofleriaceae bacterium]